MGVSEGVQAGLQPVVRVLEIVYLAFQCPDFFFEFFVLIGGPEIETAEHEHYEGLGGHFLSPFYALLVVEVLDDVKHPVYYEGGAHYDPVSDEASCDHIGHYEEELGHSVLPSIPYI